MGAGVALAIGAVLRLMGDTRYLRRSSSAAAWSSDWAAQATGDIDPLPALEVELDMDEEGPHEGGGGGGGGGAASARPAPLAPGPAALGGGAAAAAAAAAGLRIVGKKEEPSAGG